MSQYLLIIKGHSPQFDTPEEGQNLLAAYKNWAVNLGEKYIDGQRLEKSGTLIKPGLEMTTDGPFLESKEVIAGFIIVVAESQEEAVAMARSCPLVAVHTIEVRPIQGRP